MAPVWSRKFLDIQEDIEWIHSETRVLHDKNMGPSLFCQIFYRYIGGFTVQLQELQQRKSNKIQEIQEKSSLHCKSLSFTKLKAQASIYQASAYEKQGRATIALLVTKFRGYRHQSHSPNRSVVACDDYSFQNTIVFFLSQ